MIYLDNNATTEIHPEVKKEMIRCIDQEYGNPSSKYYSLAISAKNILDKARGNVAKLFGCDSQEIIFTSGSTESNNFLIKGLADTQREKKHIITSSIEHPSVLNVLRYLETKGFKVTYLPVSKEGIVDPKLLEKSISDETFLVTIMWVNNEIGSINDICKISEICYKKKIFFHVDATQAVGKIDVKLPIGVTSATFSAHKIYGPKGVGALILRKDKDGLSQKITPLLHGGEQEFGYRAGTQSVHNIAGLSKACEIVMRDFEKNILALREKELMLVNILNNKLGDQIVYNSPDNKVPGVINFQIKGIKNVIFLKKISPYIAASAGSACSITHPSETLAAIGLTDHEIHQSIRFSLSPYDDISELENIL